MAWLFRTSADAVLFPPPPSAFRLPLPAFAFLLAFHGVICPASASTSHLTALSPKPREAGFFFLARTRPFCAPSRFREESLVQGTKLYCTLSSMRLLSRSDANTAATVQSSCPTADALPQLLASCNNDPQSPAPYPPPSPCSHPRLTAVKSP